jgi:hypothetical protein
MNHTQAYVQALTGSPDTVMVWRAIHDKERGVAAHSIVGSYSEVHTTLDAYNKQGYGIFCAIQQLDGKGFTLANVETIRTHVVDLDSPTSDADCATAMQAGASFGVISSTGKYHLYWNVAPYSGNDKYSAVQRKLAVKFNGDRQVVDAARVMRVPGFYHCKGDPQLVTFHQGSGQVYQVEQLEHWLSDIEVAEIGTQRHNLGAPELAAPDAVLLINALTMLNPNELDRSEWLSISAAFKQAGWNLLPEQALIDIWQKWCSKYLENDEAENLKLWRSIRNTEVGWPTFLRRTPIRGQMIAESIPSAILQSRAEIATEASFGEFLNAQDCVAYFKDCVWVERMGEIFTPSGRFMNATQFNGTYGGKKFLVDESGKATDEAWKAALRSTVARIPSVDHVRFLPEEPSRAVIIDNLGRKGLNIYIPARVETRAGDISRWLDWLSRLIPDDSDRKIILDYLAHCIKFPGYKIPWSPLIQSTEGAGKTIFREMLMHCLGDCYVYQPKAQELIKSGSTFNAWMRAKLMIIVDEIKVDERRELVEILKPMISENRIEIQAKGVDQDVEDNVANWLFFSNFKDAVPISKNGRRWCIIFSALQSAADLERAGMTQAYFQSLFEWLRREGYAALAHYFKNYPIERGQIPMRAPESTSQNEAVDYSRSPIEQLIVDAVADGLQGFRAGFVSACAVLNLCRAAGLKLPQPKTIEQCCANLGYFKLGRAPKSYVQEDVQRRSEIYAMEGVTNVADFGKLQGYE